MGSRRAALFCVTALALAGCQGGGANPPPFNTGPASPTVATASSTISPASGGAVTATLGTSAVTIHVPPGATAGPATFTLTVYSSGAAPKTVSSKTVSSKDRTAKALPSDAVGLVQFQVDDGGVPLLKPLTASLTTPAAAAGSVFRLAGFGSLNFADVDTVTFAGTTANSDGNILYARMSLVSHTYYEFYTTAKPAAAPTPVITVTQNPTGAIGVVSTAAFSASEADPNGFPYLDHTFVFSTDNPTLGTIDPNTGTLTTGSLDAGGNVVVTDTTAGRGNPTGKGAVVVSSQRPGNNGDSFHFTGTLSSTTQQTNSNITTQPQTDTAGVDLATSVVSTQHGTSGTLTGYVSTLQSKEVDTYPLQVITTGITSGMAFTDPSGGHSTVFNLGNDAKDSNGAEFITQNDIQNGNGIIDVLPEASGAFGPNTAALQYTENDPAHFSRQRNVNPDGSYVEQGMDAFGDVQTINAHSDLSAFYDANQYSGYNFTLTAPSGSPPTIKLTLKQGNTVRSIRTFPSWIPAGTTQPSKETDVDNGSTAYPASCNVPAKYGTSGNQIVQTITRVDPALGNLETQTTTTYVAGGVGPVCIQLADNTQTFYDYTLQNGFVLFFSSNAQPIQLTSITETLTLQSASTSNGTVTQSAKRSTSSAVPRSAFAPVALARARFDHVVREKLGGMRKATFSHDFLSHGVQAL